MAIKELTPSEWLEEIDKGLKYRRLWGLEDYWGEVEALTYNVDKSQANSGPNIMISTMDGLCSSLNVPMPYVTVKGRRSDLIWKARMCEQIDNMLIQQMKMVRETERMTVSTFLWGQSIAKIGYDSEYGWDESLDIGPVLNRPPMGMTLSMFDRKQRRIEYNDYQPGMPWFSAVMPHDIVLPWGVFGIHNTPWIAHRIVRHIDSVRTDLKYEHTRELQPVLSMEDHIRSYQSPINPYRLGRADTFSDQGRNDAEYVELWEIRDRRTGKIYVIATHHNQFLRNEPDLLQINGRLPYVTMSFVPRARSFWVTPDSYYLRYHQADLSDIAIQKTKSRRLNCLKMLYMDGCVDEDQLMKLLSSEIGAGVKIRNDTGMNLQEVAQWVTAPPVNQSLSMDEESVRRNAREQVGFSRNQIGEYEASGRRTAYEAQQVAQSSELRLDRRQNGLRNVYIDTMEIVNGIISENWKLGRMVEVTGQDGAPEVYNVKGNDLKGQFDYSIGFSVGAQETIQQRRANAFQMYMQLSQDPRIDPIALAQWLALAINDPEFNTIFAQGVLDGNASSPAPVKPMPMAQGPQGSPGQQGMAMGGGQARIAPAGAGPRQASAA